MKSTYHLYRIDWIDAASQSSWIHLNDLQDPVDYTVSTVGWLIQDTDDYYVLSQNLSSSMGASDRMQIPKKWIKRKRRIQGHIIEYRD